MAALQYVDVPGYNALILRRTFVQLSKGDALIPRSKEWLTGTDARWNEQRKTWAFPSGATLEFGHVENEDTKYDYQGAAYQFVGFDELTQFSESVYEYIGFSRARRRQKMKDIGVPVRTRATSNPGGQGHGWVKRRFIEEPSENVVFVPAKVWDNPGLDVEEYIESLGYLPEGLKLQLLHGDWGVFEGAAFTVTQDHHLDPFDVPEEWDRFESMDFGVANPTCVLAWAADFDGNLIVYDSYYKDNTLVSDHAGAIRQLRIKWGTANRPVCYADPSMWARTGGRTRFGDAATDVTEFQDEGITGLIPANNKRRPGRIRITELLKPVPGRPFPRWHPRYGEKGAPRLFIVEKNCPELWKQLQDAPLLPLDSGKNEAGEIVEPEWESQHGHAVAACRYGAMARTGPSDEQDIPPDNPEWTDEQRARAQWLWDYEKQREDQPVRDQSRYLS